MLENWVNAKINCVQVLPTVCGHLVWSDPPQTMEVQSTAGSRDPEYPPGKAFRHLSGFIGCYSVERCLIKSSV